MARRKRSTRNWLFSEQLTDKQVIDTDRKIKETYPNLIPLRSYGPYRICVHSARGGFYAVDSEGQAVSGSAVSVEAAQEMCDKARKKATKREPLNISIVAYEESGVNMERFRHNGPLLVEGELVGINANGQNLRIRIDGKAEEIQNQETWLILKSKTDKVRNLQVLTKALEFMRQAVEAQEKKIESFLKEHGYLYKGSYGTLEPEAVAYKERQLRESLFRTSSQTKNKINSNNSD